YLAGMDFEPSEPSGRIELNLSKISSAEKGWRMIAAKKGKPAVSHWELLQTIGEGDRKRSLIRFRPETGRTHQLRVHALQGLGVPLLGDPVYGPVRGQNKGAPRTMLHAEAIHMTRPGKDPISAYAPFPADFAKTGLSAPEPPPPPVRTPVSDDG
ncbi:MAG: RNA pseudouridine synthase, partial [Altererythrobacter sp.]|nr:RNA pseudouridine synthase [Altererythrobacter sp.]